MKKFAGAFFCCYILGGISMMIVYAAVVGSPWHKDSHYASGEWKVQMQTPPCDSVHNIQVIYPKESGAPITIECDSMPVPTK